MEGGRKRFYIKMREIKLKKGEREAKEAERKEREKKQAGLLKKDEAMNRKK